METSPISDEKWNSQDLGKSGKFLNWLDPSPHTVDSDTCDHSIVTVDAEVFPAADQISNILVKHSN